MSLSLPGRCRPRSLRAGEQLQPGAAPRRRRLLRRRLPRRRHCAPRLQETQAEVITEVRGCVSHATFGKLLEDGNF